MTSPRKVLYAVGSAWTYAPGVLCLLLALVLLFAGAPGTVSGYLALVGLGLVFVAWVRLNW